MLILARREKASLTPGCYENERSSRISLSSWTFEFRTDIKGDSCISVCVFLLGYAGNIFLVLWVGYRTFIFRSLVITLLATCLKKVPSRDESLRMRQATHRRPAHKRWGDPIDLDAFDNSQNLQSMPARLSHTLNYLVTNLVMNNISWDIAALNE